MMSNSVRTPCGIASANSQARGVSAADAARGHCSVNEDVREKSAANLAYLFRKLARLHTCGGASSLSQAEAAQLACSLKFTLGMTGPDATEAMLELSRIDPDEFFARRQRQLDRRVRTALEVWGRVVATMPPIRNVALRDTLASLGQLESRYDTYFAAHEIPCDIDYQLSRPLESGLEGIDYIEAYLNQLLVETSWIARFTPGSCIRALERSCPDYRGLHVNLYDLLKPHEGELQQR